MPGRILFPEFALMMHLVNLKLKQKELSQSRYKENANEVLRVATGQPVLSNAQQTGIPGQRGPVAQPSRVSLVAHFDVAYFWIQETPRQPPSR